MSFLQQAFLLALPLALIPVIIHLINQHRHRTVPWAAMMFLLDARRMTKGMARLRQILILALRVLALAALILAAGRPLASGWLALTAGGEVETVLVLLDRSASMELQNLETGRSKRSTALDKLADTLGKTARGSRIVLIESARLEPLELDGPGDLVGLPHIVPTDTGANIPELLGAAADYVTANRSGRTDIWLASDVRASDWVPASGQWETLRSAFSELEAVQFYLLLYPESRADNLGVRMSRLERRQSVDGMVLVMYLVIRGAAGSGTDRIVPLEVTVNGARSVENLEVEGEEFRLQGFTLGLGNSEGRGWGRIDLPADANPLDNSFFFVFDRAPVLRTVVVSDDDQVSGAIAAAASAALDPSLEYEVEVLPTVRRAEVDWGETGLLFWHAPIPSADEPESSLLEQFVASGRSLVLLPPDGPIPDDGRSILGMSWSPGEADRSEDGLKVGWWRTESGLLRNTQDGEPLPLGSTRVFRVSTFQGESQPLLRLEDGRTLVARSVNRLPGSLFFWGTLPRSSDSSLAADGVAFFVMIHRALERGAVFLSRAQQRDAGEGALPGEEEWKRVSLRDTEADVIHPSLHAGAFQREENWVALNRPETEDEARIVNREALAGLFAGLDYRVIEDRVDDRSSLAAEIWRAFLVAMALALIAEAALCLPPRPEPEPATT